MSITASTLLPTRNGLFKVNYHNIDGDHCVSFVMGDITKSNPLVRFQSSCLFSESFHSTDCDCSLQLDESLKLIGKEKRGVVIYTYEEGRGIGLENKIKSLEIQRTRMLDTVEAFEELHFDSDPREFKLHMHALNELNVNKEVRFISNNPKKRDKLSKHGYEIKENIQLVYPVNELIKKYLRVVKNKLGHSINEKLIS